MVQNTAKENRNSDPLYKINRPSFLSINVQAQELALIQVLKRDFYSCFEPPSFSMCLPICLQFVVK